MNWYSPSIHFWNYYFSGETIFYWPVDRDRNILGMTLQQNNNFKNVYWEVNKSLKISIIWDLKSRSFKFRWYNVLSVYIFEIITFLERLFFIDESIEIKIFLGWLSSKTIISEMYTERKLNRRLILIHCNRISDSM